MTGHVRLSEWVSKHGVAAFTLDDFLFVGSKVATDPERLILVGGQAIETWGVLLNVPAPTGDKHPLTEDTDWLGSKEDAQWLCTQLGRDVEMHFPKPHEAGPSTALAFIRRPDDRVLMMDFLRAIVGVSEEEIRKLAVPVAISGITLHVLHPLLCLKSRLANVAVLPSKRRGNGPLQAEWAIDITTAFLLKATQEQSARAATRACHRVAEIAASDHARYCLLNHGIDASRAVTEEVVQSIGGRFETEDWPVKKAWIEKRQQRWREIHAKRLGGSTPEDE